MISPQGAHARCYHIPPAQLEQVASYLITLKLLGKLQFIQEGIAQVPDNGPQHTGKQGKTSLKHTGRLDIYWYIS